MQFYFTWFVFCFILGIVIILISWSTWVGFYFMIFMGSLELYIYWRCTNLFYDLHELTCYGCFCRSIWPVAPSSRHGLQQIWFFSNDKSHFSNEKSFAMTPLMIIKFHNSFFNCVILVHLFFTFQHFNLHTPACGALSKELHEATLDHQPEHARQIEEYGQAQQVERHPLIITSWRWKRLATW